MCCYECWHPVRAPVEDHPSRDKPDHPSKRETTKKAEKKKLRALHKAMKLGEVELMEKQAKHDDCRLHVLLKQHSQVQKARLHK